MGIIDRTFTDGNTDPFFDIKWKKVDVKITDYNTGETIFEGHDLEFPEYYSQQACDIIASKYFYRNIDGKGTPETSLRQVINRMVYFWSDALRDEGILNSQEQKIFEDECKYTLVHQMWAPNSPQWFNTGIKQAYGIKGESDDLYYADKNMFKEISVYKSEDRYTRSQTSACFIIPITDHLIGPDSITDHYVTETKLFKGGSGVGTNFSPIRAAGESLSSGGESSGVMSFLLGLDRNAGAIKSGGTTRRAAKMVILDIDHPDIEEFIGWKAHEEKKAQDLISIGYDGSMNGEAYSTVSGQNSNNSVRVGKDFMDKVLGKDPNPMFKLKGRQDSSLDREVDANKLWDKIAQAAWVCADPGVQFDDRYNEWNTVPNAGRINATNPCSEFAFIDNSACNLASINLEKFVEIHEGDDDICMINFNRYKFCEIVKLCQLVLEASIHWGQFPTEDVAKNSYIYRPTGLGLANIAAALLKHQIPYNSEDGRTFVSEVCSLMTAKSYLTSAEMAKKIGACFGYEDNKEAMLGILGKHKEKAYELAPRTVGIWEHAVDEAQKYGVRNMQTTVLAPTGTISLAMDCASTGIEPFFSHKTYKKCSDGSMMELVNPLAEEYVIKYCGLNNLGFDLALQDLDKIGTFRYSDVLTDYEKKVLETANEIPPLAHVKMMAAAQPFISGSISKTVNLPNEATVEDIKEIYEQAYKMGCKSISIYRDGSKGAQPLTVKKDTDDASDADNASNAVEVQEGPIDNTVGTDAPFDNDTKFYAREEYPYHAYLDKGGHLTLLQGVLEDDQEILIKADGEYIEFKSTHPIEFHELKDDVPFYEEEGNGSTSTNSDTNPDIHRDLDMDKSNKPLQRIKPGGIRSGTTHVAKIGNVELYITVSYYSDGGLCEIFVSSDKEGTTIKGLLSSLSKAISHMLQYGIDPMKIAVMLRNQQYEPAGVVERHPYIKMCSSISDLIARIIEFECNDYSGCQIQPNSFNFLNEKEIDDSGWNDLDENGVPNWASALSGHDLSSALLNDYDEDGVPYWEKFEDNTAYTGNECPICHSKRMVKSGACELCLDCGSSSSCG